MMYDDTVMMQYILEMTPPNQTTKRCEIILVIPVLDPYFENF